MTIIPIIALVIVIAILIATNRMIEVKLRAYKNIEKQVKDLRVLQNFMETVGQEDTVEDKINKINEIIIEEYDIKYSTIVVFNGAEYVIKASNVESIHYDTLTNLHNEEIFKDSVKTATPKYITIDNENEKLPYQKVEMGRAKSAMFFPLYIDNIYIGYWIMESGRMHAFDKTDSMVIEVVKNNIINILSTMSYQGALENTIRIDKYTGLYSEEYLYSKAKQIFNKYPTSAVCMFTITNIEEINEKQGRHIGNEIIAEISNIVKTKIPSQYVFVRYMGPKFVIVFSGVDEESVADFLKDMKKEIEELEIIEEAQEHVVVKVINGKRVKVRELQEKKEATPKINIVVSTYYKGTGIEQLNKKLEDYLDSADELENDINYI